MDLIEIGEHIRERRKELGLDQATLATLAGIGINALVRLERGSGNPRFDVLFNVLKTLFIFNNKYICGGIQLPHAGHIHPLIS